MPLSPTTCFYSAVRSTTILVIPCRAGSEQSVGLLFATSFSSWRFEKRHRTAFFFYPPRPCLMTNAYVPRCLPPSFLKRGFSRFLRPVPPYMSSRANPLHSPPNSPILFSILPLRRGYIIKRFPAVLFRQPFRLLVGFRVNPRDNPSIQFLAANPSFQCRVGPESLMSWTRPCAQTHFFPM